MLNCWHRKIEVCISQLKFVVFRVVVFCLDLFLNTRLLQVLNNNKLIKLMNLLSTHSFALILIRPICCYASSSRNKNDKDPRVFFFQIKILMLLIFLLFTFNFQMENIKTFKTFKIVVHSNSKFNSVSTHNDDCSHFTWNKIIKTLKIKFWVSC